MEIHDNMSSNSNDSSDESYTPKIMFERQQSSTASRMGSSSNTEKRISDSDDDSDNDYSGNFQRPAFGKHSHQELSDNNDHEDQLRLKKAKFENNEPFIEDVGQRIMKKMGYQEGKGLGKNRQGRLEPVQASKQHGRRGLGHHIPGLEETSIKWNSEEEEIKVEEDMEWLPNGHRNTLSLEELKSWIVRGPRKKTIDDESTFCDAEIVKRIVQSKSVLDNLDKTEIRRATTCSNPFETIRGAFFLNRAAVKMANIDSVCNFMFTSPPGLERTSLLYFADVCAGPGGFSEYVLWKKKWHAKGFGFTLKNENDFKLEDFYAGPCETFHPFYGPKDDGDVFDPSNQDAFRDLIMRHTDGKGVHFMMSDGGFSVEGQENIQEIISKQLYLCQCLVALMIVRTGGNFVTKLFDLFTPFSAGLVYLMYRCFEKICIFKPNTSRPANSERYLICKGKRGDTDDIMRYLCSVNHLLLKKDDLKDVLELVSLEELETEEHFVQYLRASNAALGKKQIVGLCKLVAFCENTTLIEPRQADMRRECLQRWQIPDETRTAPRNVKPAEKLRQLLDGSMEFLRSEPTKLTNDNVESVILMHPYNWYCIPCGSGPNVDEDKIATFYLGMGRRKVYQYVNQQWKQVRNVKLELPPDTLVYAEMVFELRKEKMNQYKTNAFHIIDAYFLGGENISSKNIIKRHHLIKTFCEALWKPNPGECIRVRVKDLHYFNQRISDKLRVQQRDMKNNKRAWTYEFMKTRLDDIQNKEDSPYFIPNSALFLKSVTYPWSRELSKSRNCYYFYNHNTKESTFEQDMAKDPSAGFIEAFKGRVVWYWPNDNSLSIDTLVEKLMHKLGELPNNSKYGCSNSIQVDDVRQKIHM